MRNCSLWGTHSPGPGLQRRRAGDSMNGRRLTEFPPFREHLNYERRIPRSRCRSLIFAVNDDAPVIAKQFLLILDLCVPNGAFMEQYLVVFLLFSASFTHSRLSMADDARTIIHFNIGTCQIATSTIWNVITKKKKSPSTSRGENSTFCAPINSFRGIDQTICNLWILIHAVASFGYTVLHWVYGHFTTRIKETPAGYQECYLFAGLHATEKTAVSGWARNLALTGRAANHQRRAAT